MVEVAIEEVDAESVVAWTENALDILDALHSNGDRVAFRVPPETMFFIAELVTGWRDEARRGVVPAPRSYDEHHLRQLVTYWFNITKLTDDDKKALDVEFTPPEGRAFADALVGAVGAAMSASPALAEFAVNLEREWRECQPAFVVPTT